MTVSDGPITCTCSDPGEPMTIKTHIQSGKLNAYIRLKANASGDIK